MELSDLYMISYSLLISDVKFHMLPHITLSIVRGFKFVVQIHKKKKKHIQECSVRISKHGGNWDMHICVFVSAGLGFDRVKLAISLILAPLNKFSV